MLTLRHAAVAGTAALVMGLGSAPALAQSQDGPASGAISTTVTADQQAASPSKEVRRSIPWKKTGRHHVPSCARHGKKYEFKVRLDNRCGRSFTYHLEIVRGPDRCVTVRPHKSKTAGWRYPGRLAKVTNGQSSGRC
uniref:hypothetical protein n=1 Tax=Streptomyces sp. HSW2009 TaxID=3142890 RepID=UPI0032EE613A